MSCFFCDSNFHLSQNCDIHVTEENRHLIAKSKGYCNSCLNILDINHHPRICENKNKCCYECFSKDHHTAFCQSTETKFFIPHIDKDLFQRFFQTFNSSEQVFLTNLSSSTANLMQLKQLKVLKELRLANNNKAACYYYVVVEKLILSDYSSSSYFISSIIPELITNKAKTVVVKNVKIFAADFLLLLTLHTKTLICDNVYFLSGFTFNDILLKASNTSVIEFNYSSSIIPNTWANDLLKVNDAKKLKVIKLGVLELDFNANTLATFMKKTQVDVIIRVFGFADSPISCEYCSIYCAELLGDNFSLLKPNKHDASEIPQLTIQYHFKTFLFYLAQ